MRCVEKHIARWKGNVTNNKATATIRAVASKSGQEVGRNLLETS